MRNPFVLSVLLSALALPALSDQALLSGVPEDDSRFWRGVPSSAGEALSDAGFQIIRAEGNARALRDALARVLARIDQDETVVIHLSGHFAQANSGTWYLGATAAGTDLAQVGSVGVSLDVILEIAGRVPGGAFLVLGEPERRLSHGVGLRAGIGPMDIPQGVTVLQGPEPDLTRYAASVLYRPGADLDEVLLGQDAITASGFLPSGHAIVVSDAVPSEPDTSFAQERDFWQSVLRDNTEAAYRDYLQRYPNGVFRGEANARLQDILNDPARRAEEAEAALSLSRSERRRIQADLTELGFSTRGVDGIFGGGTRAAIRGWQQGQGREVTGFIDAEQVSQLRRQANARREEAAAQAAADDALWDRIGGMDARRRDLRDYLNRYPDGRHAENARSTLQMLNEIRNSRASRAEQDDWIAALRANTAASYRAFIAAHPRGVFTAAARARLEEIAGPSRNDAREQERALNLNPVTRLLVERRLSQLLLSPGSVDGTFTPETREAISRFQQSRDLTVSGYIDQATITKMLAEFGITFRRN